MESPVPVKRVQMVLSALLAKARRKLALQATQRAEWPATRQDRALKARQLVDRRQVLESQPVQAKLEPPRPVLAAWRSDRPQKAFFAPARQLSVTLRD